MGGIVTWKKQTAKWTALFLALGVVAFVSVRAGKGFVSNKRALQLQMTARDAISEQLRGIVANLAVLRMAAREPDLSPGNASLAACLAPEGTCTVTSPELQEMFILKDSVQETGKIIAGTMDSPGSYSITGKIACTPDEDANCPGWLTHIWFWAECGNKATSCDLAEVIWVRYQTVPSETFINLPALPADDVFMQTPASFAYSVRVPRP